MRAKRRLFALLFAMITIWSMTLGVNAMGSSDSEGEYLYYAGEVSGEGWFQGDGIKCQIFNCTADKLDIYYGGKKAITLAPIGMPGSVLSFDSGSYRYVILYNRSTKRMDIWFSAYNGAMIADTSMATVAFAKGAKCEVEGDEINAQRLYSLGTSYMSIDANTANTYLYSGLKTADAVINLALSAKPVTADKMLTKESNFYWYKLYNSVK